MPSIVVLVKHVPDSWAQLSLDSDYTLQREGVDEVIDEINEKAVEAALRIKEAHPDAGWEITALTLGTPRAEAAVRKAISMGADRGVVVTDEGLAGSDLLGTAWALSAAIDALGAGDLIVTGNSSTDGRMGALPGVLAEYRQWPAATHLKAIDVVDNTVTGTRVTPDGEWELRLSLPAIVSVTESIGSARFPNFKGIMAGKKAQVAQWSLADIGVDPATVGLANAATAVTSCEQRPERTRGEMIYDHGDSAPAIVEFLEKNHLI